jgi:hypothetical protein
MSPSSRSKVSLEGSIKQAVNTAKRNGSPKRQLTFIGPHGVTSYNCCENLRAYKLALCAAQIRMAVQLALTTELDV